MGGFGPPTRKERPTMNIRKKYTVYAREYPKAHKTTEFVVATICVLTFFTSAFAIIVVLDATMY